MQLIKNTDNIEVFDMFNKKYGQKVLSLFPELNEIEIHAVNHNNATTIAQKDLDEKDTFAFFFNEKENPKYAEIIINKDACKLFDFSEQELMAAIAHEIGHIIKRVRLNFVIIEQDEEIISDDYVCKIGLGSPLLSLLNKFVNSGFYLEKALEPIRQRIHIIERSIKQKENTDIATNIFQI